MYKGKPIREPSPFFGGEMIFFIEDRNIVIPCLKGITFRELNMFEKVFKERKNKVGMYT